MISSRRRLGELVLAAVGFLVFTLIVFRPTPSELAHTLPAFRGSSADALLLVWATSHVSQTLASQPGSLFDAPIFSPIPGTLALGDHMIGQALLGWPIWWTTHNPLLEFNLLSLISYVATGTAMFAYTRKVIGGGIVPALAAGMVAAFTPYRYHSPLWLQVLWIAFVPLALLAWLRFVEQPRLRPWAAWVAAWCAHSLCGQYLTLYFALVMGAVGGFALLAAPRRRDPWLWLGTLAAPLAVALILLPTWYPYMALRATQGTVRNGGMGTPLTFLLPGPGTLLAQLGVADVSLGPGVVAMTLALLGLGVGRRSRSAPERLTVPRAFIHGVHTIGLATSLALMFAPIQWQHALPGLDMLRVTNRAFFVGLPFLAALAATAVAWVMAAVPRRSAVAVGATLLALLMVDTGTPPRERQRFPVANDLPAGVRQLAQLPPGGLIYEMATTPDTLTRAMYHSIFHRQRLPVGYSGFDPPVGSYLTTRLAEFPAPAALRLLRELGVSHVLGRFPPGPGATALATEAERRGLRMVGRFETETLFDLAGLTADPALSPLAPLPHAGWRLTASTGGAPDALLDGELATIWSAPPLPAATPSITIDFGASVAIAGIRLSVPRTHPQAAFGCTVETSDDTVRWTRLDATFAADDLRSLQLNPPPVVSFSARMPPTATRFLRIANPPLAATQQLVAGFLTSASSMGLSPWLPWTGAWELAELEVLIEPAQP